MDGAAPQATAPSEVAARAAEMSLRGALLATLAYYDLRDLPLAAVGCWRYLLRPRGAPSYERRTALGDRAPKLREVEETLRALADAGALETRCGFYFFRGRGALVEGWIAKHARAEAKLKKLRRVVWWWQALPFLRAVAVTGSLAFHNARPASDLDVLVIASPNRVWTVRFLLTVGLDLFRLRRRPRGPTADRICLNHYLASDTLAFPYRSLYTAMEYARMVPLVGADLCAAFRAVNRPWMEEYLLRVFPDAVPHRKVLPPSSALRFIQRVGEGLLSGYPGDLLERALARLQRARIARGGDAVSPGGRVVATEARAEFHPHSREAPLLAAFNARIAALGLADAFGAQRDSGLRI